ncbi:MAG: hypothetical protein H6831_11165 [Planctomycetes bacterium]|nr:hypothetical protein [Planctomycetota bacterium]MCB9904958.1 hypothetical protein [Planctomycetota bacterium]
MRTRTTHLLALLCAVAPAACAAREPRSSDDRITWQPCELVGDPLLLGIAFPDDRLGFAVGGTTERGPSVVLHSEDAGASWTEVEVGTNGRLYDVDFPTLRRGYAVGVGLILRTKDRGRSWEPVTIPADRWLSAVDFVSREVGFAVGGDERAAVLWTTTDGGDHWTPIDERLPDAGRVALRDVRFFDEEHGVVLGEQGVLCETRDGGATWTLVETDSDAWLRSIFVEGERTWIAASPGLLTRAAGEARWTEIGAFAEEKLCDVHFLDDRLGWVTRFAGSVHATSDGGATWFPSLELRGTPTSLTQLGDEWLFVASDAGIWRLALPR